MNDLIPRIGNLIRQRSLPWQLDGHSLTVSFGDRGRRQVVRLARRGRHYIFTSRVLSAPEVTKTAKRWRHLAYRAWRRNAQSDIVTFAFDTSDHLIGRIVQPAATCDLEELHLYIETLAQECDEFEYVLTGRDVH